MAVFKSRARRMAAAVLAIMLATETALAGTIQVEGACLSQFSWMDNSLTQGSSPCFVAAFLLGACTDGSWKVPAITNATSHYTAPTAQTQNNCQCSWAAYNTMQACADCQGTDFTSTIQTWASWIQECTPTSLTSNSFFPQAVIIPNETAIPFWATTDPTTWPNGIFDPSTAQSIANEGKPDITQTNRNDSPSSGSKSNPGAIAGGVVGGVIVAVLLGLIAFFVIRRRHAAARVRTYKGTSVVLQPHSRSNSDYTTRKPYDPAQSLSPGPSLPMTMDTTTVGGFSMQSGYGYGVGVGVGVNAAGAGGGGHPHPSFQQTPSFGSYPTLPVTPAPHADPTKPFATAMGMFALNASNPTISSGTAAYHPPGMPMPVPTGSPPAASIAMPGHGHAHTYSGQSTYTQTSDTREGAISPYVLPPMAAEPMDPDAEDDAHPHASPSSPGHHAKGLSSGSGSSPGADRDRDYFTTVAPPTAAAFRSERERINPPAYSPEAEERGLSEDGAGGDSLDVQPADTATQALSGTTLAQGSSAPAQSEMGSSRGRRGYTGDQKRPY